MRFSGRRSLTAVQQLVNLRANPNCVGQGHVKMGGLIWSFELAPTPLSRFYRGRITFSERSVPQVFVEYPDLADLAAGRRLPHVYQQRPTILCLYLPGVREWAPYMRIDQTIVPWAALWFFYFEEWLGSDDWKGGGVHPNETSEPKVESCH